ALAGDPGDVAERAEEPASAAASAASCSGSAADHYFKLFGGQVFHDGYPKQLPCRIDVFDSTPVFSSLVLLVVDDLRATVHALWPTPKRKKARGNPRAFVHRARPSSRAVSRLGRSLLDRALAHHVRGRARAALRILQCGKRLVALGGRRCDSVVLLL